MPAALVGDAITLGQVLASLVGNAVKLTHRGSVCVDVDVTEPPGETATLEWRVSDTGIGIERSKLGDVFEDFAQAKDQVGETFGGTGLGLSICRCILQLHHSSKRVRQRARQRLHVLVPRHLARRRGVTIRRRLGHVR